MGRIQIQLQHGDGGDNLTIQCGRFKTVRHIGATHGTPESPDDLLNHQLIAFKTASSIKLTDPDGKSGEFNTRVAGHRLTIDDGLSYKIATRCGAGIAIHSLWSVHKELAEGGLVQVLPDYRMDAEPALWLVYPKSNVLTAKVRVFIDFLIERIGNHPPWLD